MNDLIAFIKARLDEEESEARWVAQFNGTDTWRYDDGVAAAQRDSEHRFDGRCQVAVHESVRGPRTHIDFCGQYPALTNEMKFIARHDPARVLAQAGAIREIIKSYEIWVEGAQFPDFEGGLVSGLEDALSNISKIWADHPDFREDWDE